MDPATNCRYSLAYGALFILLLQLCFGKFKVFPNQKKLHICCL